MKAVKGLISAILVVFIVVNLLLIGCLNQVRTVVSEDGVNALIASVDPETVYESLDDDTKETIASSLEASGIPRENIEAILGTDAAKEIISLVANSYKDEFLSGGDLAQMEILPAELVEEVFRLLSTNERELSLAMYGSADAESLAKYREAIAELRTVIDENAENLPKTLGDLSADSGNPVEPSAPVSGNGFSGTFRYSLGGRELTGPDVLRIVNIVAGGVPILFLGILSVLWLLLILLMWRKRLAFLIWFSIPFFLTAPLFLIMSRIPAYSADLAAHASLDPSLAPIVNNLIASAARSFRLYGLILAGAAILCVALYIAFRKSPKDEPPTYDTPRYVNDAQ